MNYIKFFLKPKMRNNRAFTLVETLVALSIFSVSVLGLLVILSNGIADTNYIKNKIVATYLAQDGIEIIRNLRDTYMLYSPSGTRWTDFTNKITPTGNTLCDQLNGNGCYFGDLTAADFSDSTQPITNIPITACGANCAYLRYDSTTGQYGYTSGTNSLFRRRIQATAISAYEMKITSIVSWTQKGNTHQISFSENLFNWTE